MTFKNFLKIALLTLTSILVAVLTFIYFWYRSGGLQQMIVTEVGKKIFSINQDKKPLLDDNGNYISSEDEINFIQKFLGFEKPQTHLVLFLNNTELRPGGGFIGSYAVIKMNRANPQIIKVEGTEILDNVAPKDFPSEAPQPILDYLGVDRLYFRDSNWSPDYAIAASTSLDLYRKQKGVLADEIDSVIAFTPTLIEELLKLTGPVQAGGIEFTAKNFTEKLNYEVEYGFADKGIHFDQRKQLLSELTYNVVMSSAKNFLFHWNDYKTLIERMLAQKQVMMYSPHDEYQAIFVAKNWAGKMSKTDSDYLLWVDANLGALKTDWAMDRSLYYSIYKNAEGKYVAKATMKFVNKGRFDWRTTRYRTYARVYVPIGSELIKTEGAMLTDRSTASRATDQGVENGRQWFGNFITIEPGQSKELTYEYYVSPSIVERLNRNDYKLLIQKQLGTNNTKLTLGLDFGNKLSFANPGEKTDHHGDNRYDYSATLITDLEFEVRTR